MGVAADCLERVSRGYRVVTSVFTYTPFFRYSRSSRRPSGMFALLNWMADMFAAG